MSTEAEPTQNTSSESNEKASVTEIIEVEADKVTETVKEILEDGKVKRLTISSIDGKTLLDIPYVAGLSIMAIVTLFMPALAVITPLGLLLGRLTIKVVR